MGPRASKSNPCSGDQGASSPRDEHLPGTSQGGDSGADVNTQFGYVGIDQLDLTRIEPEAKSYTQGSHRPASLPAHSGFLEPGSRRWREVRPGLACTSVPLHRSNPLARLHSEARAADATPGHPRLAAVSVGPTISVKSTVVSTQSGSAAVRWPVTNSWISSRGSTSPARRNDQHWKLNEASTRDLEAMYLPSSMETSWSACR